MRSQDKAIVSEEGLLMPGFRLYTETEELSLSQYGLRESYSFKADNSHVHMVRRDKLCLIELILRERYGSSGKVCKQ